MSLGCDMRWLAAAVMALIVAGVAPCSAKTPGKTYCFYGVCHKVLTLEATGRAVGVLQTVTASFYGDAKEDLANPSNATSSGAMLKANAPDNAASPILPNGTVVLLWNPKNGQAATARINNSGPYHGKRTLDVSKGLARALGFIGSGGADLKMLVVSPPTHEEAQYRRGRNYEPVQGPIGTFESPMLALATLKGPVRVASLAAESALPSPQLVQRRTGKSKRGAVIGAVSPTAAPSPSAAVVGSPPPAHHEPATWETAIATSAVPPRAPLRPRSDDQACGGKLDSACGFHSN